MRHQLTELTVVTVTITRVRHILMIRSALLALISVARAVEQELLGLSQFRDCVQFGRWRLMMMLGNCCFCPRCDCSSGRNCLGLLGFSLAADVAGEAGKFSKQPTHNARPPAVSRSSDQLKQLSDTWATRPSSGAGELLSLRRLFFDPKWGLVDEPFLLQRRQTLH